jgi:hypothetical protein
VERFGIRLLGKFVGAFLWKAFNDEVKMLAHKLNQTFGCLTHSE